VAVRGPDGVLTYRELDRVADQMAQALAALGVQKGDRVGLWAEKSARLVAAMQAVLRLGAVYVPLDPLSPSARVGLILRDCGIQQVLTTASRRAQVEALGASACLWLESPAPPAAEGAPFAAVALADSDPAYILYTSGSTGVPKGVCISHRNALAFVEWAAAELHARPSDRFANHAPLFFDLSVLDLYVAFLCGGSVTLIPDGLAFAPSQLVDFLAKEEISVWYSVPSALILMMDQGGLLDRTFPALRVVLFAGEPFPIKHLRRLRGAWPGPRFLNLYGPTETNVCTAYELTAVPDDSAEGIPIGRACSSDRVYLHAPGPLSEEDPREVGEIYVEGPTVMLGYWGHPPQGDRPYATGDLGFFRPDGELLYLGRRDNMVKIRGRRIELGEIENALLSHPALKDVAVLVMGSGLSAKLVAFVVAEAPVSLLALKRHCAERVPRYMIVDEVRRLEVLPRTRNGKLDRRALAAG